MKLVKCLSNAELKEIINKPFITANEIRQVACCGKNKAYELYNQVKDKYKDSYLPTGMIPTKELLKILKM